MKKRQEHIRNDVAEQPWLSAGGMNPISAKGLVIRLGNLSLREEEVLDLLARGLFYKEIGERLNISTETVRTHVKRICQKMQVRNRLEAVAKHGPDLDVQGEMEQRVSLLPAKVRPHHPRQEKFNNKVI